MIESYIDFREITEKILRRHEDNMVALESLKEQYDELLENNGMSAMQYDRDPVQSSPTDDNLINKAIQRQTIKEMIGRLESEKSSYNRAWERLTDEEKAILENFFLLGLRPADAVNYLCSHFSYDRATVYRHKDAALKRFKRLFFG